MPKSMGSATKKSQPQRRALITRCIMCAHDTASVFISRRCPPSHLPPRLHADFCHHVNLCLDYKQHVLIRATCAAHVLVTRYASLITSCISSEMIYSCPQPVAIRMSFSSFIANSRTLTHPSRFRLGSVHSPTPLLCLVSLASTQTPTPASSPCARAWYVLARCISGGGAQHMVHTRTHYRLVSATLPVVTQPARRVKESAGQMWHARMLSQCRASSHGMPHTACLHASHGMPHMACQSRQRRLPREGGSRPLCLSSVSK